MIDETDEEFEEILEKVDKDKKRAEAYFREVDPLDPWVWGRFVCQCCGQPDNRFLTLDQSERMLCFNCILGSARSGGVCPRARVST
jgi:hypothetical protein